MDNYELKTARLLKKTRNHGRNAIKSFGARCRLTLAIVQTSNIRVFLPGVILVPLVLKLIARPSCVAFLISEGSDYPVLSCTIVLHLLRSLASWRASLMSKKYLIWSDHLMGLRLLGLLPSILPVTITSSRL